MSSETLFIVYDRETHEVRVVSTSKIDMLSVASEELSRRICNSLQVHNVDFNREEGLPIMVHAKSSGVLECMVPDLVKTCGVEEIEWEYNSLSWKEIPTPIIGQMAEKFYFYG